MMGPAMAAGAAEEYEDCLSALADGGLRGSTPFLRMVAAQNRRSRAGEFPDRNLTMCLR
jgi:hypothetical protein